GQPVDGDVGHPVLLNDHVDIDDLRQLQQQLVASVQQVVGLLSRSDDPEYLAVDVGQTLGQAVDALDFQLGQLVQIPAQVGQLFVYVLERGGQRQRSFPDHRPGRVA